MRFVHVEKMESVLRLFYREEVPATLFPLNQHSQGFVDTAKAQFDAHGYPLGVGGKRVRPSLLCLVASAFGTSDADDLSCYPAAALEMVHTYSLVHDDIPCMDNDDLRRGKPTTHRVYGEPQAVLVGDGLLTDSFAVVASLLKTDKLDQVKASLVTAHLVRLLSDAAGSRGMVLGQWLDIANESVCSRAPMQDISLQDLKKIHNLKTGRLIAAAFELGCVVAYGTRVLDWSDDELSDSLVFARKIGLNIGLTFQVVDDILDVVQSSETLGKTAGKDEATGKVTMVSLLGLEKAKLYAKELTENALMSLNIWKDSWGWEVNEKPYKELERLMMALSDRSV